MIDVQGNICNISACAHYVLEGKSVCLSLWFRLRSSSIGQNPEAASYKQYINQKEDF